jgi:hypothetical protein
MIDQISTSTLNIITARSNSWAIEVALEELEQVSFKDMAFLLLNTASNCMIDRKVCAIIVDAAVATEKLFEEHPRQSIYGFKHEENDVSLALGISHESYMESRDKAIRFLDQLIHSGNTATFNTIAEQLSDPMERAMCLITIRQHVLEIIDKQFAGCVGCPDRDWCLKETCKKEG